MYLRESSPDAAWQWEKVKMRVKTRVKRTFSHIVSSESCTLLFFFFVDTTVQSLLLSTADHVTTGRNNGCYMQTFIFL